MERDAAGTHDHAVPLTRTTLTFSDGTTATSYSVGGKTGATGPTGPEAVVAIVPTAIDWSAGTATLQATLRVNGTAVTSGVTYKWTKGTDTESLGTARTLAVSDLNASYNCTCTW